MLKNKNILITGGAGFIGTHLFETLIKNDNYIVLIDNFNECYYTGKEENLASVTKNYETLRDYRLIKGDLLNKSIYNDIPSDIDVIFHLAAHAGVQYSMLNAEKVTRNNILGFVNILEFALKKEIEKLVYASSSTVYGNPTYTPVDEDHPKNPVCPYGLSKLCGEIYAEYYFREYSIPITSLRFYSVYGPRGRPDMVVGIFFNRIFQNKELIINGDGEQLRDFTYVSDIINGLILSSEKKESSGQAFNLGLSNPISINQLVDKIYDIADKPKKVKYGDKKKGDMEITHADITKATKILNYKPKVDIDTGLKKTYQWYLERLKTKE
ncbi:MAG: NAD-dependent epimerase/dehydratase family protein [Promethearchaeota archaeon]